MSVIRKTVSFIVAVIFIFNQTAFGLATINASGDMGDTLSTKKEAHALGEKKFLAKMGPGAIDFDSYEPAIFTGAEPVIPETDIIPADYTNTPEAWIINPILQKTDLIEAFKYFRDHEAQLGGDDLNKKLEIKSGVFAFNPTKGEVPVAKIVEFSDKCTLIIHEDFVRMWNDIRSNDIWIETELPDPDDPGKTAKRTVSLAWALFYRIAKHEMSDLRSSGLNFTPKSEGHIFANLATGVVGFDADETKANAISGRYAQINDSIWLWFLGSYCFANSTQFNNNTLRERLNWFFDGEDAINADLPLEFPNIMNDPSGREEAINMALLVNYHYYNNLIRMRTSPERNIEITPSFDPGESVTLYPGSTTLIKDEDTYPMPEALVKAYSQSKIITAGQIIGVPKEIKPQAERVGLTPRGARFLASKGVKVLVEKGAGREHFSDEEYLAAGAELVNTADEVWAKATIIKKVKEPLESEQKYFRKGLTIFTYLHLASPELKGLTSQLLRDGVIGIAYETIETIEGGKKATPVLRPMSIIAGDLGGYYAALYANHKITVASNDENPDTIGLSGEGNTLLGTIKKDYEKVQKVSAFDGTLTGKQAVVLGGGVSGESMARRLLESGAAVTITDTNTDRLDELRDIFKDHMDKLTLIEVGRDINVVEPDLLKKYKDADILGGCILVPGGIAPQMSKSLLSKISVDKPKVIIDIALDQGGNFYGSYSRTYADPVFLDEFKNTRFCVPNMPDAVGRIASIELEKTNIFYTLALAMGKRNALKIFPELEGGFNTEDGELVHDKVKAAYPEMVRTSRASTPAKLRSWINTETGKRHLGEVPKKGTWVPDTIIARIRYGTNRRGKKGKSPEDMLLLMAKYMHEVEVFSTPKILEIYTAHYEELGFDAPSENRSSAIRTIARDLFESQNSLFTLGLLDFIPGEGPDGEYLLDLTIEGLDAIHELREQLQDDAALSKNTEDEDSLIDVISEYVLNVERDNGPGAELPGNKKESIWKAVNTFHNENIEIFIPQEISLSKSIRRAIAALKQKGVLINIIRYRSKSNEKAHDLIEKMSESYANGSKKIVITTPDVGTDVADYVAEEGNEDFADMLSNVRFLNMEIPEKWSSEEQETVFQAHLLMTSIIARLLEQGQDHFVDMRSLLTNMLEGSFHSMNIDEDVFVQRLLETDKANISTEATINRLQYFLDPFKAISLIDKLEIDMRATQEFWTYA